MSSGNSSGGGIGLSGVVFVVFLVLKLVDKIDWSWWWVTAPLWGPVLLLLAVLAVAFVIHAALSARSARAWRK